MTSLKRSTHHYPTVCVWVCVGGGVCVGVRVRVRVGVGVCVCLRRWDGF